MKQEENSAYELFLHTGMIADYLSYVGAKQSAAPAVRGGAAGEHDAYNNRCDCSAGVCDG